MNHKVILGLLFVFHFSISIFHWYRSKIKLGDVDYFYNKALNSESWISTFGIGSKFIAFLIYPLVKIEASYLTLFLLFALVSLIPYVYLYKLFLEKKDDKKAILLYFLFLPSIHFWTVFFGKESILLLIMFFVIKKIKSIDYKNPLLYLGLLVILLIRPYLCVIMLFSFLLAVLLDKSIATVLRNKIRNISILLIIMMTPVLLFFLKIKSWSGITNNYYKVARYASKNGNSSIDLLESNYLERLFLTLFRPFFYDVISVFHLFASLENLIFLIFLTMLIVRIRKSNFFIQAIDVKFALFTALFLILFYSIYMYNLGLANRMKVMFLPYLVYAYLSLQSSKTRML